MPPSWSMHGWLLSLKLEAVVVAAARKRLDLLLHRKHGDNLTDAEARRFERSYVEHLGQHGSRSNNLLSLSLSLLTAAAHLSDCRASSSLLLHRPAWLDRHCFGDAQGITRFVRPRFRHLHGSNGVGISRGAAGRSTNTEAGTQVSRSTLQQQHIPRHHHHHLTATPPSHLSVAQRLRMS